MANPTDIPGATLDLNFMIPGSLPVGLTFTRSTTGTYLDIDGLLQTAAIDTPRWDYDPGSRTVKGLLIEEARTNNFLQSGDFTNAAWGKASATLNTGAMLGPNGPNTGVGIIASNGAVGYLSQSYNFVAGSAITVSCFMKAGSATTAYCLLPSQLWNDAVNRYGLFDLQAGTVVSTQGTTASASISPAGNGWYRCSLTVTPANALLVAPQFRTVANGDGVSTQFWAWGAQVEAGSFPTSYIPTTGAAVTRALEVCQTPTAPWFVTTYSLAMEFDLPSTAGVVGGIADTVFNNAAYFTNNAFIRAGAGNVASDVWAVNGAVNKTCGVLDPGVVIKCCNNGGTIGTSAITGVAQSTATRLTIGNPPWSLTPAFNGHMRRVTYWPRALTDLELQKVTAPDPVGSPALTLDFMTPGVLPTGVVFTRASTGTYLDINGLLQTAAVDAPRWDYNPATRMLRGVLFEDARTNAALQSGDFANAAWIKNLTALNTTPMLGPNGPATGVGLITTAGTIGYLVQGIQFTAGVTITWSCFLKAGASLTATLLLDGLSWNDGINRFVVFDLNAGKVSTVQGGGAVGTIYPAGNGWYRCAIRATPDITGIRGPQIRASAVGDGVSTQFWAWGAQHEIGSVMTSYIPTTTTNIARSADTCSITPSGSWFNTGTGTMFFEFDVTAPTGVIGGFVGSSFNDSFYISVGSSGPNAIIAGVSKTAPAGVISSAGIVQKVVASYSTGRLAASNNGGAAAVNAALAASPYPWTTSFVVGSAPWGPGTSSIMGHARRATYWPRALTDAEMIAETGDAYRMQATVAS